MVYVSVRGRIWLQAEAANMVESVGNYTKHRRVPVIINEGAKYFTIFVPAISGESVAHAYQVLLAEELKRLGVSVCKYCERGIFLKSMHAEVLESTIKEEIKKKICEEEIKNLNEENKEIYRKAIDMIEICGKETSDSKSPKKEKEKAPKKEKDGLKVLMEAINILESSIVKNCGVEDIGGFLYTGDPNVKRTSSFLTGYMIPVKEALTAAIIEPQLHSRYALGTPYMQSTEEAAAGQIIYYVEVSSAVFNFTFDLDTRYIGRYTFHSENYGKPIINENEIINRAEASLNALRRLLIEFPVGAKRTRFNPADVRWESIAIAVSDDVWTMPSSFVNDYLKRAAEKKNKVNCNTTIFAYAGEGCAADKCYGTPEEAITEAINDAISRIKGHKGDGGEGGDKKGGEGGKSAEEKRKKLLEEMLEKL